MKPAMSGNVESDMNKRRLVFAAASIAVLVVVVVVLLNSPDFIAGFRDGWNH